MVRPRLIVRLRHFGNVGRWDSLPDEHGHESVVTENVARRQPTCAKCRRAETLVQLDELRRAGEIGVLAAMLPERSVTFSIETVVDGQKVSDLIP